MKNIGVLLICFLIAVCSGQVQPSTAIEPADSEIELVLTEPPQATAALALPGAQITPMAELPEPADFDGLPLPAERGEFFAASGICANSSARMA